MSDHEHHDSHAGLYFSVFIALCCFTAASVVADILHLPSKTVTATIVLAIATAKALCVMMYFMHLKFERAWKYMLLAPTFILAAGLMVALIPDVGRHYYTIDTPQVHEYEADQALKGDHPAGHH
jgi:cytochrome c oxidase subunit 4